MRALLVQIASHMPWSAAHIADGARGSHCGGQTREPFTVQWLVFQFVVDASDIVIRQGIVARADPLKILVHPESPRRGDRLSPHSSGVILAAAAFLCMSASQWCENAPLFQCSAHSFLPACFCVKSELTEQYVPFCASVCIDVRVFKMRTQKLLTGQVFFYINFTKQILT